MMVHIPTNQESIEWAARNKEEQRRRYGPEPLEKAAETIANLRDALEQAQKERDAQYEENVSQIMRYATLEAQRDAAQKDAKDVRALLGEYDKHIGTLVLSEKGRLVPRHDTVEHWAVVLRPLRTRIEAMLEQKP